MYTNPIATISILVIFFILTYHKAHAQTTLWKSSLGGKARLILQATKQPNIYKGAIEISLKDGWKTFWRNPGSSGMKPTLTMQKNFKADIFYPTPSLYKNYNDWDNIYKDHVFLPIKITRIDNPKFDNISGMVMVGLCGKMCIPLDFKFNFNEQELHNTNFTEQVLLEQAFASLPKPATKELRYLKIKEKNILICFAKNNIKQPQLFLDGKEIDLSVPKLLEDNKNSALFKVTSCSNFKKGAIIHYNYVNGNSSIYGTFIL